jgi:hypothetical protein
MFSITGTDDVADLIRWSTAFFERFGLAVDLPGGLRPGPAESLAQATADGFTDAIALPSATWQHQHLRLATAMAGGDDRSTPDVAVDSRVGERTAGVVAVGRPAGPYILLLRPDPTDDDDLRGLTAPCRSPSAATVDGIHRSLAQPGRSATGSRHRSVRSHLRAPFRVFRTLLYET